MTTNNIDKVIIADSQFLVIETLRDLIQKDKRYLLAGIAESKFDLCELLEKTKKGLLITDFTTVDYSGLEYLKTIKDEFPQIKILVLTNNLSKNEFLTLTRYGINNIANKNIDRDELLSAFQATLKGKKFYSDGVLDLYLDLSETKYTVEETKNLTASEFEIVRMIARGLTTKEIANQRIISYHTVSTHRKNIFKKIGVSNVSELIIHAIKAGWIDNIEYYI